MRGPLPVYVEDPVRRLRDRAQAMDGLKRSKQALGAEVISRFNDFAPPTLLAQASRINFSTRLFNLIVTNVPGPQIPLYVLGRELEDVFPVAFLPREPRAGDRDHELQRRHRLRPARRLRRDGGHRAIWASTSRTPWWSCSRRRAAGPSPHPPLRRPTRARQRPPAPANRRGTLCADVSRLPLDFVAAGRPGVERAQAPLHRRARPRRSSRSSPNPRRRPRPRACNTSTSASGRSTSSRART